MISRTRNLALALLALSAAAIIPARAATFTTSRFEITFADGWQSFTPGGAGDSVLAVMSTASTLGYCVMSAGATDHPITAQEVDSMVQAGGGGDSLIKVTDGSKTLGGKSFTYVEYKSADTSGGDGRVRIYYTSAGSIQFTALLSYEAGAATPVAQVETALGTLSLKSTPIRRVAARVRAPVPADHDILGRMRPLLARTILFRLPAH